MAQKESENKAQKQDRPKEYRLPAAQYIGAHCLGSLNERATRALLRNRFETYMNTIGIPEDPEE